MFFICSNFLAGVYIQSRYWWCFSILEKFRIFYNEVIYIGWFSEIVELIWKIQNSSSISWSSGKSGFRISVSGIFLVSIFFFFFRQSVSLEFSTHPKIERQYIMGYQPMTQRVGGVGISKSWRKSFWVCNSALWTQYTSGSKFWAKARFFEV